VIDENGNPIERASVKVKSRDVSFSTTKYGEFWRILLPGIYKLEVTLPPPKKNDVVPTLIFDETYRIDIYAIIIPLARCTARLCFVSLPSVKFVLYVTLTHIYRYRQVFSNGYVPREVEFMVIEQHPTLLNVTLYSVKVSHADRECARWNVRSICPMYDQLLINYRAFQDVLKFVTCKTEAVRKRRRDRIRFVQREYRWKTLSSASGPHVALPTTIGRRCG